MSMKTDAIAHAIFFLLTSIKRISAVIVQINLHLQFPVAIDFTTRNHMVLQ